MGWDGGLRLSRGGVYRERKQGMRKMTDDKR